MENLPFGLHEPRFYQGLASGEIAADVMTIPATRIQDLVAMGVHETKDLALVLPVKL